jgi:hypothetical protein
MGSLRTPSGGEAVASDMQPSGHPNEGEVVQNVGAMVWDGTGWWPQRGAAEDGNAPEETALVSNGLLNQSGRVDRQRNNSYDVVALASEARTKTTFSPIQINYNFSKLFIRLVMTGPVGTGTLQVTIGANNGTIAEFVPLTPSSEVNIHWYEAAPGLNNADEEAGAVTTTPKVYAQTVNLFVPREFILGVVHSNSSSWTYELLYGLTL